MNCSEATNLLDQLRHDDLTSSLEKDVQTHLASCPACADRMRDDAALAVLLRQRSDEIAKELPAGFSARVMAALPPGEAHRIDYRLRFRVFALGALAIAAVAAAVILPLRFSQKSAAEAASLAAENEAQIHLLEVRSPETHPLVFKTGEGRTVIWMISDTEFNEARAPTESQGASPQK
jgi:anti-sigma factor RsiW